jgi:N-acetylmuramoyl-L-alanine amidase
MPHKLKYLIIHCTATPEGRAVYPADIRDWHTKPVAEGGRGWKQVGYSDMIMLDGMIMNLVQYNDDDKVDPWEITNGVAGINGLSRHVVYVGGMDKKNKLAKDTRTAKQKETMRNYVRGLIAQYPSLLVAGHCQFDTKKACPSFDVPEWLKSIGVQPKNIYQP